MKTEEILNEKQLSDFLDRLDNKLEDLNERMTAAHFNQLTGVSHENMSLINDEISKVTMDESILSLIKKWLKKAENNRLSKRLEHFYRQFRNARIHNDKQLFHLQNSLQKKIIQFQPVINGVPVSRTEKDRILSQEKDNNLRRDAYLATKKLDRMIEDDLLHLMKERNLLAEQMGYQSFIQLGLELQELNREDLSELFESIRDQTQDEWQNVTGEAAQALGKTKLDPWDLTYYQESLLPSPGVEPFPKEGIISKFKTVLKKTGGDLDKLPIQVVIQDIPYGGLCMPFRYNTDIRILSNPRDGFMGYDTLFHEFGHGIQAAKLDNSSHIVAGGDPPFFWEGIAGIYEHLMQSEEVLTQLFSLDPEAVRQIQFRSRIFRMIWFRNIAVVCNVEWAAYDGEKDLESVLRAQTKHYLGFDLPAHIGWAGNTLYTTHPLYNQNYVLMDVMALQTIEAIKERFGSYPNEHLFDFINKEYIEPAGWKTWEQKIVNATGSKLNADALGRYLSRK